MTSAAELLTETTASHAVVVGATTLLVVACVVLHYEALNVFSRVLRHLHMPPRARILVLIFAILAAHVTEIWIFGFGYFGLSETPGHGGLVGSHDRPAGPRVFSAVCFDAGPRRHRARRCDRFLAGTGPSRLRAAHLVGVVHCVEMQRFWRS
jgi:hypothetical protein